MPAAGALHDATGNLVAADILHLKPPLGTPPHGSCPPSPREDAAQHAIAHLSLRSSSPAHEAPLHRLSPALDVPLLHCSFAVCKYNRFSDRWAGHAEMLTLGSHGVMVSITSNIGSDGADRTKYHVNTIARCSAGKSYSIRCQDWTNQEVLLCCSILIILTNQSVRTPELIFEILKNIGLCCNRLQMFTSAEAKAFVDIPMWR
ncbi:hypothetical protein QYE76_063936 [Lolium multiflorum]|uniref:Uncharacterized protein n=1 Tax=Lolium multiflorum TaxID=4521 RepID=A0AAD8S5J4_LOLMU|nr:hypothetical protein QYE76_063936 [Lolium multiflorum]